MKERLNSGLKIWWLPRGDGSEIYHNAQWRKAEQTQNHKSETISFLQYYTSTIPPRAEPRQLVTVHVKERL
jgi:hypothetical protein